MGGGVFDQFRAQAQRQAGTAGVGAGWVREGCDWSSVEPSPGQWTWSACDSLMSDSKAAGLQPLLQFFYSVPWCTTADVPGLSVGTIAHYPPCDYTQYEDFVFHLVSRYGPNSNGLADGDPNYGQNLVHYWEVGNEPDVKGSFLLPGSIPESQAASTYALILYHAHSAIKRADSSAQVLFGGLALNLGSTSPTYRSTFFQDVLNDPTYPGARYFDIANFHNYGSKLDALNKMNAVRANLASVGASKPVWITEAGYPSDTSRQSLTSYYPTGEAGQAAYLQDLLFYSISPDVGAAKVFWFDSEDTATDTTAYCTDGLLYISGYQCNQHGPAPSNATLVAKQAVATYTNVIALTDSTPPTAALASPAPNSQVAGRVTLTATAADNIGLAKVEFYVDGALLQTDLYPPYQAGWDTTTLPGGSTHTIVVKAYDLLWNVTSSAPVTLTVADTTAPTVALTSPTPGSTVTGLVPLTATASDNVGVTKVDFFVNSTLIGTATAAPYTVNWDTTSYRQGATYSLYARAYDAAGNSTKSAVISVTLADTVAPTTTVSSPWNGATVTGTVNIQATAGDNVGVTKVEFYVDGSLLGTDTTRTYSTSWNTTGLTQGSTHTLTTKAYDAAGNVGLSAPVTVTIRDVTAPTVQITSPDDGSTVTRGTTITVTATASDNVGVTKVIFKLNGSARCTVTAAPYTCSWSVPMTTGVQYTWTAEAYDAAGNHTTSPGVTATTSK